MTELLVWLKAAPTNAIPIATAVLGAFVAIVVAVLTQWIVGRRARTDHLTKKLEELYLLLLEWMDESVAAKVALDELVKCQPLSADQRSKLLERYSKPRADRRVSMYIDFYFPRRLARFRQELFEANRGFARVIRLMGQGKETTEADIQRVWLRLSTTLVPLRQEIVDNKDYLTENRLIKGPYRKWRGDRGDA